MKSGLLRKVVLLTVVGYMFNSAVPAYAANKSGVKNFMFISKTTWDDIEEEIGKADEEGDYDYCWDDYEIGGCKAQLICESFDEGVTMSRILWRYYGSDADFEQITESLENDFPDCIESTAQGFRKYNYATTVWKEDDSTESYAKEYAENGYHHVLSTSLSSEGDEFVIDIYPDACYEVDFATVDDIDDGKNRDENGLVQDKSEVPYSYAITIKDSLNKSDSSVKIDKIYYSEGLQHLDYELYLFVLSDGTEFTVAMSNSGADSLIDDQYNSEGWYEILSKYFVGNMVYYELDKNFVLNH